MIQYVVTGAHAYTPGLLKSSRLFELQTLGYNRALRARRLPRATYIFTDMDRLGFWELELAARLYRVLVAAGLRVLNDPARVRQRYALLRALRQAGMNDFDVRRAGDCLEGLRYPVFLRTVSAHRGPLSDLLPDRAAAEDAVARALGQGVPLEQLILVEYCTEPVRAGLYRKLSVYAVGDRMVPWTSVHDAGWNAKQGQEGVAGEELYDDEYRTVAEDRYGEWVRPAFAHAAISYGRADFGLVGGRPQVYEINSNPSVGRLKPHPSPARVAAATLCARMLEEAVAAVDTPAAGAPVRVDDPVLAGQRRKDRYMTFARWMP